MTATLYWDGKTSGGVQGGWAAVLFAASPLVASGRSRQLRPSEAKSSQVAELMGLDAGLDWVGGVRGLSSLKVRGDCRDVVRMVKDGMKLKDSPANQKANGLAAQVRTKLDALKVPVDLAWTPRGLNGLAHRVAAGGEAGATPVPPDETAVRETAYALWEKAGCPHGLDLLFWHQAEELVASRLLVFGGLPP